MQIGKEGGKGADRRSRVKSRQKPEKGRIFMSHFDTPAQFMREESF